MKLFLQIADSGEYTLLAKSPATPEECYDHWCLIIDKQNLTSGSNEFRNYMDQQKAYNSLLSEYNRIKASLTVLCFTVDVDIISFLKSRGYNIVQTDSDSYTESINKAWRRSDNLITRINMKFNQIEKMNKNQVRVKTPTFDSIMADLIKEKYNVPEDITLVRYLELKKLINKDLDGKRTRGRNKVK